MRRSVSRGFTLVEVLIAIFIAAMIATLAVQSLTAATSAMNRGAESGDQLAELDRFFLALEQDLRSVRSGNDFKFIGQSVDENLSSSEFVNEDDFLGYGDQYESIDIRQQRKNLLEALDLDHQWLTFVRGDWVNFGTRPRSEFQHVNYAWYRGSIWRFFRPINREVFGDQTVPDEVFYEDVSLARRLVTSVTRLEIRYLTPGAQPTSASAWVEEWPPANASRASFPAAVEVTIELENLGELKRLFLLGIES